MALFIEGPLRPLRHRNYRLFWFGYIVSNSGAWIQSVAQAWLVYEITGSAVWLGAVGFIRAFPIILLALVGGTVADRLPQRRILYATQTVQMTGAFVLAYLTYTQQVQIWHVIALAAMSAASQAFEQPARHTLVPTLVAAEELHAAISLNAIAFNGAAAFGPSLTGVLVPWVGLAGCFFINGVSFAAVFVALALMRLPKARSASGRAHGLWSDLVAGIRYVRGQPLIVALVSMTAVTNFLARPYQQFMTVFARDVFGGDVGLAGLMQAAPSVGTILFMLTVAGLGDLRWKGKLLVVSGVTFPLALIVFAWSPTPILASLVLVVVGGFVMTWQTTANTLLQELSDRPMRGRVMSLFTITAMAMQPLGQGPMGYSIAAFGPRWALTLGAAVALAYILYVAGLRVRAIWRLT